MNRLEQAIARYRMIMNKRGFLEVYGAGDTAVNERMIDMAILSEDYIRLLDENSALKSQLSKSQVKRIVTQVNSRGDMPPLPIKDSVSDY